VKNSGSAVILLVLLVGSAFAQGRGFINPAPGFSPAPVFQGSFGNVVFPGGTAAPGVTRFFPNVVFPAGNPPKIYSPFTVTDPTLASSRFGQGNAGFGAGFRGGVGVGVGGGFGRGNGLGRGNGVVAVPYYVPIYVGGYAGYSGYGGDAPPPDAAAAPGGPPPGGAQPNVIVVYPPASGPQAPPTFGGGFGDFAAGPLPPPSPAQAAGAGPAPGPASSDQSSAFAPASYYLIAYKDHTIYSAVAYWVERDTLHYFTTGATHNQVSLALVDKDLTQRLNEELGNNLQLPKN
jgi:hypothetical protein